MKKSALSAVYLVVFLDMLGFGIMIPVVRDLTKFLVSNSHIYWPSPEIYMGILMAVYSGSQMISAPFLGRLSDIYGRKPIFLVSALGNVASYVVWILANQYWLFLFGRILSGITGGNIAIAQSILADHTTPEQRPRAMGLLGACIGMGFVLGPFLGGLLIDFNQSIDVESIEINQYWPIGLACLGLSLVTVVMIVFNRFDLAWRVSSKDNRVGITRVIASFKANVTRKIYSAQLLTQISFVIFEVLFAWILQKQYDFDLKDTFYFFGFQGLLLAVVQGGIYRRVEKKHPPEYWAKLGFMGSFVGMLILPWVGYLEPTSFMGISLKVILLSLVLLLMALSLGFGAPSLNAYASIHAPKNEQGQMMGNMQALAAFARFSAPVLATSLYALSLPLPFLLGAIMCLVAWFIFSHPIVNKTSKPSI